MKQREKIKRLGHAWLALAVSCMSSCSVFQSPPGEDHYVIDPVCKTWVDKRESYQCTHNGKKYYFDRLSCKDSFRMSPADFSQLVTAGSRPLPGDTLAKKEPVTSR